MDELKRNHIEANPAIYASLEANHFDKAPMACLCFLGLFPRTAYPTGTLS